MAEALMNVSSTKEGGSVVRLPSRMKGNKLCKGKRDIKSKLQVCLRLPPQGTCCNYSVELARSEIMHCLEE